MARCVAGDMAQAVEGDGREGGVGRPVGREVVRPCFRQGVWCGTDAGVRYDVRRECAICRGCVRVHVRGGRVVRGLSWSGRSHRIRCG